MDSFVEVIGHAILVEQVAEYRVDLSLSVRAAHADTALNEATELRGQCVRALKEAGLRAEELSEGGNTQWSPWFWKKKPGLETSYKILISCRETKRLYAALDALQPLFENQRYLLSVSMLKPKFETSAIDRAASQAKAIVNARDQAQIIATEAGIELASIIQIEELSTGQSHSGIYGDEDWRGYAVAAAAGSLAEDTSGYEELEGAKKASTLRYRVRFAIAQA